MNQSVLKNGGWNPVLRMNKSVLKHGGWIPVLRMNKSVHTYEFEPSVEDE